MADKDKFLMRAKDWVLLIGAIGGLLAGLGKIFVLANASENNTVKIAKLEPMVNIHETKLAVNDERWAQIQISLASLHRKMDRRNRREDSE